MLLDFFLWIEWRYYAWRHNNLAQNMLTHFFQRQTLGIIVGITCPFREILVHRKGRGQAGERYYKKGSKKVSCKSHILYASCSEQHSALSFIFAHICAGKFDLYLLYFDSAQEWRNRTVAEFMCSKI